MVATERVVVLMSPAEKAALVAKAVLSGRISAGELIRRAMQAYDEATQIEAQNYGGDGEFLTIRVRGRDLLANPDRKIFYRRGLFWEADRAVVVKGGYEGLARVTPMPL